MLIDAIVSGASGLLQVAATGFLASQLGLPDALIMGTGVFYLVYAAAVAAVATRKPIPRAVAWLIMGGNLLWALACLASLVGGPLAPTLLGKGYVIMQAVAVAVFAELQYFGLRRASPRWA